MARRASFRLVALRFAALCGIAALAGCARTADRDQRAICASAAAGLTSPVRA